jgi:hypothetical protein
MSFPSYPPIAVRQVPGTGNVTYVQPGSTISSRDASALSALHGSVTGHRPGASFLDHPLRASSSSAGAVPGQAALITIAKPPAYPSAPLTSSRVTYAQGGHQVPGKRPAL